MRRMFALSALFTILAALWPAAVWAGATDVRITEIMYDAAGSDTDHEWVELWNGGNEDVTIVGGSGTGSWRFNDGTNHTFAATPVIDSLTLASGDFLIISASTTIFRVDYPNFSGNLAKVSFSLGNTAETLFLRIGTSGIPWSEVSYSNTQGGNNNGKTLAWNRETNSWFESVESGGTPGRFAEAASEPPPPPEPSPAPPPEEQGQQTANSLQPIADGLQQSYDLTADLRISEFLPNPVGSDMEEWIEIYNPMNRTADLTGWKLDDGESGSNPYEFPTGAQIQPGAYEVFLRRSTVLQLNNDVDSVRLIRPDGVIKEEVAYGEALEGKSYAKDGIVWKWAGTPTPGAENIFLKPIVPSQQPTADNENQEAGHPAGDDPKGQIENQELATKTTKSTSKNQKYVFEGVVTVPPGVFGTQYFYAQNEKLGLQIYMYKKDFPSMDVGTKIRAAGILGVAYGEDRLKLASKDDIVVLEETEIIPEELSFEDLNDSKIGMLVSVEGEVIDKSKSSFVLAEEEVELEIVWKKGAGEMPDVFPGDTAKVAGILQKNKDGFRVLPRGADDVEIIKKTDLAVSGQEENGGASLNAWAYAAIPLLALGVAFGVKKFGQIRKNDIV